MHRSGVGAKIRLDLAKKFGIQRANLAKYFMFRNEVQYYESIRVMV